MPRLLRANTILLVLTLLIAGSLQPGFGPQTLAGSNLPVVGKSASPASQPSALGKNPASKLAGSRAFASVPVRAAASPKSAALLPRALPPQSGAPNPPVLFAPGNGGSGVS